jgi:hypothetical protein
MKKLKKAKIDKHLWAGRLSMVRITVTCKSTFSVKAVPIKLVEWLKG